MPKETYDTGVKRKVIEKERDMIRNHLIRGPKKKKAEDLRVAFFPGAEALENTVAYEVLGIPQENITAIERDAHNFEYWKKNSSFQMTDKPMDAKEFFANYTGEPFDVISLDYDGMFGEEAVGTLVDIVNKQKLNDRGVFCSNIYAKREQDGTKGYYGLVKSARAAMELMDGGNFSDPIMERAAIDAMSIKDNGAGKMQTHIDPVKVRDGIVGGFELDKLRSEGSLELYSHIFMGLGKMDNVMAPPLYFKDPQHVQWEKEIDAKIKQMPTAQKEILGWKEGNPRTLETLKAQLRRNYIDRLAFDIGDYIVSKGHSSKLFNCLIPIDSEFYFPIKIEPYTYTSDNGSIMHTDLFLLDRKKDFLKRFQKLYDTLFTSNFPEGPGSDARVDFANRTGQGKALLRNHKKYMKEMKRTANELDARSYMSNLPPRINLGSSQKPAIRSKNRLREIVRSGLSAEEITTQYNVSDKISGSLPAFIAHRTMETYEPIVKKEKKVVVEKIKVSKEKTPKAHFNMMPRKDYRTLVADNLLSDNARLRMKYFEQDTRNLSENRRTQLSESLVESGWSRDISNRKPSDLEVYAFFDDITMNFVHQKKGLAPGKIRSIWDNVVNSDNLYETIPLPEVKPLIKKNKPKKLSQDKNQEIYEYIQAGFSDEDVMKEFGLSKRQLGARKAWVTMRA